MNHINIFTKGALDRTTQSSIMPDIALGDTGPKNDNDDLLAAKKASSTAMQTDASARTFHRFGDLPPEIRAKIWAMAWPMRAAIPLRPSWTNAQLDDFAQNVVFRDEMVRTKFWFNKNTDVIFFNGESITRLSIVSGPFNYDDVFQAALDPATTFLLHVNILDAWMEPEDGFRFLQNGLRSLYDRYLKTRDHIYICVGGLPILLYTDEGRRRAVREGLFSGDDEELRFVPVNDKALIKKYEASRHDFPSRENLSDAQLVMLQIADFLMWDKGLGYGKGEEIMELDGRLKKDHPLVQEHQFRLPEFTPVLVFETMTQEMGDCSIMLDRLPSMRPKYPEEDSSRARLFLRRWWLRRCWDPLMELWSRFR
ncbi:hypothetical protein J7T55_007158 [Diaporthe amygdali]|uniref:uncharacterized protein n=1 Tax=Phomopsis amygdali TaxID=1214568 RepID=UPI0022FE09DF|nr:uncharacterized protein J7T55_007158 [Diaporthe amygdali]KAJ0108040.1 hypothetical protein J7T55_007158 [Diaporthe amygdali]